MIMEIKKIELKTGGDDDYEIKVQEKLNDFKVQNEMLIRKPSVMQANHLSDKLTPEFERMSQLIFDGEDKNEQMTRQYNHLQAFEDNFQDFVKSGDLRMP